MLLAAIVPGAAAALSLLCAVRATTQRRAARSKAKGVAYTRIGSNKSIFDEDFCHYAGYFTLYDKLFKDCIDEHDDSKFHSGIKMNSNSDEADGLNDKRKFVALYLFSCKDPEEEVNRLMSAAPTLERYEVLVDLFDKAWLDGPFYEYFFKFTDAGLEKSEANWRELKPSMREQPCRKIDEAVSMRTVEYLKGTPAADAVAETFLHLLLRSSSESGISYDDLSELLATTLESGDREETIKQYIKPVMDELMGLSPVSSAHAARCVRIMLDSMKDSDGEEAKEMVMKLFDWEGLSFRLVVEDVAKYLEFAAELKIDPVQVTVRINNFYKGLYTEHCKGILSALSAYYLGVSDADGQLRLRKIIDDSDLTSGLPDGLILRLYADSAKLGADEFEEAEYLRWRLREALESKPVKIAETQPKDIDPVLLFILIKIREDDPSILDILREVDSIMLDLLKEKDS
ncbi:hypothetical protein PAPHI01_1415 [Pancytospora philotis]|nr:hypothetical protein PAPHI01_1415 [Pancytospora philotis]